MESAKFIVLEGPDGAGKTTIAALVAERLAGRGVQYVSRKAISTVSEYAERLMEPMASMLWKSGDSSDLPDSFWAHLQGCWFVAHGHQVVAPALKLGHVVVDGWNYKLCSSLINQGYTPSEIEVLFSRIRTPDHVVLLAVQPQTLWARRMGEFRPAELGIHGSYSELGIRSFLDYQAKSLANFQDMAARLGWDVIEISADEEPAETTGRVAEAVARFLGAERPADSASAV
jgi:thymidylate kinase